MNGRVNIDAQGNFSSTNLPGNGASGRIKKASWLERSVTIGGLRLNKGSLIDHLNTLLPDGEKLDKRWIIGSSDKRVRDAFKLIYPNQSSLVKPFTPVVVSSTELKKINQLVEKFHEIGNTADEINMEFEKEGVFYYRNSPIIFGNLFIALNQYAKTGNLEDSIQIDQAQGQFSTLQPTTVKETFRHAIDKSAHGGLVMTIAAIEVAPEASEAQKKLAAIGKEVQKFVKTLDIK